MLQQQAAESLSQAALAALVAICRFTVETLISRLNKVKRQPQEVM
jgi:hypothetical protein